MVAVLAVLAALVVLPALVVQHHLAAVRSNLLRWQPEHEVQLSVKGMPLLVLL